MRPELKLLTDPQIESIIEDAIHTLSQVGVYIENQEAHRLLESAGLRIEQSRAYFTEKSIRSALATVPSEVKLYDRQGEQELCLGGMNVHFDPGSAALFILDPIAGRRRQPRAQDCVDLARVTAACQHIQAQATAVIPGDVHEDLADRYRLYLALLHCGKPVVTGTFRKEAFAPMQRMLVAIRGSEEALRSRPLAIFDCAPTPPLKWSDLTCQALIDCARGGIPAELVSMPMAGATSPVTLREVVVQHCAENLSGIVIHQLATPGAPIIFGGSPSALDMRFGTTPMGAMETMMVDVAYAHVGKHLGLPTHAYMGLSDAKTPDYQGGLESGLGMTLAALAGINMISGPGMLDFESCQSLEKLVLDNETCGMTKRLLAGISERSKAEATDLLQAVVNEGHFLGHPHTRKNFRAELFIPGVVIDRANYGEWERQGARSAFAVAQQEVQRILSQGNSAPLDEHTQQELRRIIEQETKQLGQDRLPLS